MPTLRLILDWTLYRLALLLAAPLIPLRLLVARPARARLSGSTGASGWRLARRR